MRETKSFHEIIDEHIIEVPIIQREYAQGRTTKKVNSIRKRFVTDLVKAITEDKEVHLGFVYGKIEGKESARRKVLNREAVNSILEAVKFYANNLELKIKAEVEETESEKTDQGILKFVPLDGQQRLTTLYVLCWYLYYKGAESNNLRWLNHFKYSNRKSALAFCNELKDTENIKELRKKQKKNTETSIKELISNSSFFLKKWNKDATVSGILEMLFSIEKEFKSDFDFNNISIENLPFKFDFMDLDSLNQTDELYVKMNSRGKQLSDYEHFKSWLQEKYKDNTDQEQQEWLQSFWKKLDTDWLNYFWRNIDVDFNALDNFYYNYIKNLALMYCLASNNEIPFEKVKDLYGQIRNTEIYDSKKITYIPLENYLIKWGKDEDEKSFFIFNIDVLKFIERTFESLIYLEEKENFDKLNLEKIICNPFVENQITDFFLKSNLFTPSLWNTVFYYSFLVFINDRENVQYSIESLKVWLRYTRNTIYNTYIQSPENFNSALKQINNLEAYKFNIGEAILDNNVGNVFFENTQFDEEKIKLNLLQEYKWEESIFGIENHPYLFGQINFILDFSKDGSGNYVLENFKKYCNAVSKLYGEEIRLNSEKVLERFLFCQDDYLPEYKSNHIFCTGSLGGLRTKNENWRLFFKGNKINILKDSIDKLEDKKITPELLSDYIKNYLKTKNLKQSDWKYLFLKYPQAINYCKESAIRWNSANDIRLLKGFPITAYHSELRTYCFFLDNRNKNSTDENRIAPEKFFPFSKFWYFEDKNTAGHAGCYLEGFNVQEKEYKLEIKYSKEEDEYQLCFYHKVDEIESRKTDINLEKLGFVLDEKDGQYLKTVPYKKLENELKKLCTELKTLNHD
ncbi:DUF262 domain-containing protein [Chryseobacterium formosus]|uniref:DUF262 domain-containing protein n=1 Tax=Chryseobacterium formosus TaxID=1537363 RepID=A0ABT3XRF7_9FLAO|nr:DUF262 domain-containing protein [Chryseobacterium formosus]MCX8524690.1 DUF262 domain-containing protein [Chryseobacterium formosus]